MAQNPPTVYQLKITLNGVRPPIWRRLLISSATDLADLHDIIQIAMGWTDSHLHQFIAGGKQYGEPDPDFDVQTIDEFGVPIGSLLKKEKQSIVYEYDFGDGWEHKVTLEKILPAGSVEDVPKCIDGRRGCPPEDVGGAYGYVNFLQILADKTHPEHEETVEWAGDDFDPARFDLEEVNEALAGER